jgi:hypothetical protein
MNPRSGANLGKAFSELLLIKVQLILKKTSPLIFLDCYAPAEEEILDGRGEIKA